MTPTFWLCAMCVAVGALLGAAFQHFLAGLWSGVILAGVLTYVLGATK